MSPSAPSDDTASESYKDPEVLRRLLIDERLGKVEIADRFGVSDHTIHYWLDKHDIVKPWKDADLMRKLYHDEGLTMREMGERFGCSMKTVQKWMERLDIERRSVAEAQYRLHDMDIDDAIWRDPDVLYEWVFLRGYEPHELAERWGVHSNAILRGLRTHAPGLPGGYEPDPEMKDRLLQRVLAEDDLDPDAADALDIDLESARLQTRYADFLRDHPREDIEDDEAALRFLYHDEALTTREIGALYGANNTSVRTWLVNLDIERRSAGKRPASERPDHDFTR